MTFIVATAPTACGIETHLNTVELIHEQNHVATAPTACGIETS